MGTRYDKIAIITSLEHVVLDGRHIVTPASFSAQEGGIERIGCSSLLYSCTKVVYP